MRWIWILERKDGRLLWFFLLLHSPKIICFVNGGTSFDDYFLSVCDVIMWVLFVRILRQKVCVFCCGNIVIVRFV